MMRVPFSFCSTLRSNAFCFRRYLSLAALMLWMVTLGAIQATAADMSLTLAWEGSNESGIFYKLFCRTEGESFDYDSPKWTGDQTTCTITIPDDETCYFVVRACDNYGNESADSNEVQYTPLDTDGDGLQDVLELSYGTDPKVADTDGDGIDDGAELAYWGKQHPEYLLNPDVDGDGFLDGDEINNGSDPASNGSQPAVVVYEDAEDGSIDRWGVRGGKIASAFIENVENDTQDGRVIKLTGKGLKTRFTLQRRYGLPWRNTQLFNISWRMKFSGRFRVEIVVLTASGKKRILTYEPADKDRLGRGKRVRFGLGSDITDGNWYCFARDLQSDLETAQPGERIAEVDSFMVRGSGLVDDVKLMAAIPNDHDTDGDGLSDREEIEEYKTNPHRVDTDGDGINDFSEVVYWNGTGLPDDKDGDGVSNVLDFDSDNDGIGDGQEIEMNTNPGDNSDVPQKVCYEAGEENGLLLRWRVYKGKPNLASIESIDDPEKGQVVKISGRRLKIGFQLSNRYGAPWRNGAHHRVRFDMNFAERYVIEFEVWTSAGTRLLRYEPRDVDRLGHRKKVRFGLGSETMQGEWIRFDRNLEDDLHLAQPGVDIKEIEYMRIRGSGMIDNVELSN